MEIVEDRMYKITSKFEKNVITASASWLPALDGFRGLAVLSIIIVHYHSSTFSSMPIAWLGVSGFFALSAFLIAYLTKKEQIRTGTYSIKNFFIRRILRIWPLYFFLFITLVYILGEWSPFPSIADKNVNHQFLREQLWNLPTFMVSWGYAFNQIHGSFYPSGFNFWMPDFLGVFWSISVEEQFYIIFPLFFFLFLRWPFKTVVTTIAIGLSLRTLWLFLPSVIVGSGGGMYYAPFSYLDTFALGAAAGYLAADRGALLQSRIVKSLKLPGTEFALGIFLLITAFYWAKVCWNPYGWYAPLIYTILAIIFPLLLLRITAYPACLGARILQFSILRNIGFLSFGMYMWHLFIFRVCLSGDSIIKGYRLTSQFANENFVWIRFIYILTIIMAVSCLSYLFIERPFLMIKAKLTKNRNDISAVKYFRILAGCAVVILFFNVFVFF